MKNAFAIVTLSGLLAACASVPSVPPPAPAVLAEERIEAMPDPSFAADADEETSSSEAGLPKVVLTKDMLFRLMKAELELQNGQWQGPYMTMLGLAQQTRDPRLAQRAADIAVAAKQTGEATVAVRLWRELAPTSEEASQYYVGLALLSDDLDEVGRIFAQRLKDAGSAARGATMYQVQQYLLRAHDKAAADALLVRLLAPYQDTFEAHVLLAQSAAGRGDQPGALAHAKAAMALRPDAEIGILTLAQITTDQDEVDRLLAAFLAANPGSREVRAAYARVLVGQKQFDAARKQFALMLADQPENSGTLYALGILSMQLNDNAGAERYFERFMAVADKDGGAERDPGRVLLILSSLAEDRGDLVSASRWLAQVDEEDPGNYFAAQLKRGQLLAAQGDLAGAEKLFAALKTDEPLQQAQIVAARAQLLRQAGDSEGAFAVLADGAKRYPLNPDLLYDYALIAEKTGRMDIMEASLRAVIEQAPDNHHAYNALGYSLAERNVRLPEALALIDKALKMAPGDPFIMDSMGWVQYRLGNLDAAEANLRQAYALRNDADIAVHLGEVLWHKGRKADAQKLWRDARARDPKNDTLKSTLARLHTSL
ncbi:MAG: tetratricopeptide repeat protein [Massilia sp.]